MKKILVSAAVLSFFAQSKACAEYYADGDYFNLFTQSIIRDKAYLPFLHTYESRFYEGPKVMVINDNIVLWQKYFGNKLNYKETEFLVNHMPIEDINSYKNGGSNAILGKLGKYGNYKEGIDYLQEAKYLEPYMRINFVASPDSFYYDHEEKLRNATQLDYNRTSGVLEALYNEAKSPEIKLRYGYQIVRFNHYTRNYDKAVAAFQKFVAPLNIKSAPYWLALDQLAGAQRGLRQNQDANWNFFQVFSHSNTRKESAFVSMKLSDSASFKNIMSRAKSPEEKNMAYFLLGYDDYANPIPMMEKMAEIDPKSEILKVMAARSINELERNYLPLDYRGNDFGGGPRTAPSIDENKNKTSTKTTDNETNTPAEAKKESVWDRIVNFFKNIFSSEKGGDAPKNSDEKARQSDEDLLKNPRRIPIFTKSQYGDEISGKKAQDFADNLEKFTEDLKGKSDDEFWQIADAYMKFLKKDYAASTEILDKIQTKNPEYAEQISRLKILNEVTAAPKIDQKFEDEVYKKYPQLFAEKQDSAGAAGSTEDFVRDVFANRYFLQGEDGKSFLMNNQLSDLQYYPNPVLARSVQDFVNKKDKSEFEKNIISKNVDMQSPEAFFNVIYGDDEMRRGNFAKAKSYYENAKDFGGIPRFEWDYSNEKSVKKQIVYKPGEYDGYHGVSALVFGHNVWESFQSPENQSMKAEDFARNYPFIKNNMTKLELADALVKLQKENSANANQLIGNVLYNTTDLGYFREMFMMDTNNSGWQKNDVGRDQLPDYQYYYKNYSFDPAVSQDNFDTALKFYANALKFATDREQKSRILFQMASAEQGKYYQWAAKQRQNFDYNDPDYDKKMEAFDKSLADTKNQKFRTYFSQLKQSFADTETSKNLMGSCSYYSYFMKGK